MMVKIIGPKKKKERKKRKDYRGKDCSHFVCIGLMIYFEFYIVILCFYPSYSALLFPDDFIEKQWQIMTCLFC